MTTEEVASERGAGVARGSGPSMHPSDLSARQEVALLARALHREGWDDHNVGHITYRLMQGETFLTLPWGCGWDEVRPEDMVVIDIDGHVMEGEMVVTPAILLHLEFHRANAGCNVAVHQHPRYTTIWSAAGGVPPAYDQRSAYLADEDFAFYDDYRGGVTDVESARAAVAALGKKRCAILRNHGAFVVADSIAQAFVYATTLEWRCKQAWHVHAIGGESVMPKQGRDWLAATIAATPGGVPPNEWPYAVRRELRADPTLLS